MEGYWPTQSAHTAGEVTSAAGQPKLKGVRGFSANGARRSFDLLGNSVRYRNHKRPGSPSHRPLGRPGSKSAMGFVGSISKYSSQMPVHGLLVVPKQHRKMSIEARTLDTQCPACLLVCTLFAIRLLMIQIRSCVGSRRKRLCCCNRIRWTVQCGQQNVVRQMEHLRLLRWHSTLRLDLTSHVHEAYGQASSTDS